jgi:RNA polymerase sigma-70 factor, ECF subfamily
MRDVLGDDLVVQRVVAGETELFELLVRRHNQRLFRIVRALTRRDDDAEEALQVAYVTAWRRLATFDGRASFVTWLTRIALRSALQIARSRRAPAAAPRHDEPALADTTDQALARGELARLLERSIEALPEGARVVFVLRMVEGLSTEEVAQHLDLSESAVKVRLHRAREALRQGLLARAIECGAIDATWQIDGKRCDRIVARVFGGIRCGA